MYYNPAYINNNDDRFFLVPLILGGIGGAAIASTARPRPVYVNPPPQPAYPAYGPYSYGYNYYGGYSYNQPGYIYR